MTARTPITLIFPMAGRGVRFGGTFKPFLPLRDETFIEAAFRPFRKWLESIRQVVFVFLEDQEAAFGVSERLLAMFAGVPLRTVVLDRSTAGPAETMACAVERAELTGPAIVCDCDHAVDVDPMFALLGQSGDADCILPVWDLAGESIASWSVAAVDERGRVTAIAEKRLPAGEKPMVGGRMAGVIGAYYFRDIGRIAAVCREHSYLNLSEAIARLVAERQEVIAVPIQHAEFFGDPARLQQAVKGATPRAFEQH